MNSKSSQFVIEDIYVDLEYLNQEHTKIANYEIDVKFDYQGLLDPEISTFTYQVQAMSDEMGGFLSEYVITEDGKIVSNQEGNVTISEGMVWNIKFIADDTHFFNMSYRFGYDY
jgi:transglutaminase/protease-like cytokinesis protein 3